jgi:acetyl esterase
LHRIIMNVNIALRVCGLLFLSLAALSARAASQPRHCLPLTPTATQGGALLPGALMNVRFGGTATVPLALDVYPHADAAVRPLALVLRGGAGTVGQRSSYVGQLVELLGDSGYVVATADYRSEGVDAAVEDLTAALRLLTMCHAATLHVDQYKLVIVAEDTAVPPALVLAGRLQELRLGRFAGAPATPAALVAIGGRFATAPDPAVPTRVVHGAADTEVPISEARALCARARSSCNVVDVAGASHRVENWWPSQWGYKRELVQWLSTLVGPVPSLARAAASTSALRKRVVFDAANNLALDVWTPAGAGPFGVVVLVHGGGWEAGDRVTYIAPMLALVAAKGLAWVSIDYRLTPDVTNREQVADVRSALRWLRDHSRELHLDPGRMVLVGESASGQLVAHLAASEPGLAGIVSFYGVYDLEANAGDPANPRSLARRLFRLTALDASGRETLRAYSPVHQAAKPAPPMLLLAGTADRLVIQQRAYATALRSAGARVDVVELEGAPHGMEAWNDNPAWRVWQKQVADWIEARVE